MIFPIALTGPIGNHAVDPSYFGTIQNIVINHHRFYGDVPLIDNKSKFSVWFPYFIRSKNGLITTTYWIIPNIISLIINLRKNVKTSVSFKNNINLADHTVIIFTFMLLKFFLFNTCSSIYTLVNTSNNISRYYFFSIYTNS